MKYGVIDLGSNTFHLLIAEYQGSGTFREIFRHRAFTGLSKGGIEIIQNESIEKGLNTLDYFAKVLKAHDLTHVSVIGTAALRTASNRQEFIEAAERIIGYPIKIIEGTQEAWYIYKGITMIPETNVGTHLIADIGGGSTEFILIENGEMIKAQSFKLGIGVLANLFHHNEPISKSSLTDMHIYIKETIAPFLSEVKNFEIQQLIGASGSFEILESLCGATVNYGSYNYIDLQSLYNVHDLIVNADLEQRLIIEKLPTERAKLSPVGLALMKSIVNIFNPAKIMVSSYAMKEGILRELIEGQ